MVTRAHTHFCRALGSVRVSWGQAVCLELVPSVCVQVMSDWLVCCKTEKYFPVGHFQLLLFQQGYLVLLTLTSLSPTISLCLSSDVLALPIFKQEDSSLPSDCESSSLNPPFQYVLCAATSPAVKLHDETLTYLNQGDLLTHSCHGKLLNYAVPKPTLTW